MKKIFAAAVAAFLITPHVAKAFCTSGTLYDTYTGTCVPWSKYGERPNGDFSGNTQNNPGYINESQQIKPWSNPSQSQSTSCTYAAPCCPEYISGKLNWAYPYCPK